MGQDYVQRKQAKKVRKRLGREAMEKMDATVDFDDKDGKKKRERIKKNQSRRLCRGMCYNMPNVTEEDRVTWSAEDLAVAGGEKDFDFPKVRRRRHPAPLLPLVPLHLISC
jgi:hypothetical protein